jgi:hypothetical protein
MYACMHTFFLHVYMHACVNICVIVHACLFVEHVNLCVCLLACTDVRLYACICAPPVRAQVFERRREERDALAASLAASGADADASQAAVLALDQRFDAELAVAQQACLDSLGAVRVVDGGGGPHA